MEHEEASIVVGVGSQLFILQEHLSPSEPKAREMAVHEGIIYGARVAPV